MYILEVATELPLQDNGAVAPDTTGAKNLQPSLLPVTSVCSSSTGGGGGVELLY